MVFMSTVVDDKKSIAAEPSNTNFWESVHIPNLTQNNFSVLKNTKANQTAMENTKIRKTLRTNWNVIDMYGKRGWNEIKNYVQVSRNTRYVLYETMYEVLLGSPVIPFFSAPARTPC